MTKYLATLLILLGGAAVGQPPEGYNKKYSMQNFTNRVLLSEKDLDNAIIFRSNFSQETPDTNVFPAGVRGLRLVCCNLDNVAIPPGTIVDDMGGTCGLRRRFKVQNDGRDWILITKNGRDVPDKVVSEKVEVWAGRSVDPADIPSDQEVEQKRVACRSELLLKLIQEGRQFARKAENDFCDELRFLPEDMTLDKVAERRARRGNIR